MKFIRFEQATSVMELPEPVGPIPFVKVDDNTAVMCVRLTEQDIHAIKKNNYRLFILAPLIPPEKTRPIHVVLFNRDPFQKKPSSNGQDKEG